MILVSNFVKVNISIIRIKDKHVFMDLADTKLLENSEKTAV